MTYFINPWIFYLIDLADTIHKFFSTISLISIAFIVSVLVIDWCEDNNFEYIAKIKKYLFLVPICLLIAIFTPSKDTCKEMLVASIVTHENVDYGKEQIKDIIDYIFEKFEEEENND